MEVEKISTIPLIAHENYINRIGDKLGYSERTIKAKMSKILSKL